MKPETLEALKASIEKWERNVEATRFSDVLLGASYCPLCNLFYRVMESEPCKGCPVAVKTGEPYCGRTPYEWVVDIYEAWIMRAATVEQWQEAAQVEVDFLKSLLPVET
jgi:hypothetical protein